MLESRTTSLFDKVYEVCLVGDFLNYLLVGANFESRSQLKF